MCAPESKLCAVVPAKDTIEENGADLASKGFDVPIAPFLNGNLYESYVKYPPRKMQSLVYTGPVTISNYEKFHSLGPNEVNGYPHTR